VSCEFFVETSFQARTRAIIEQAKSILATGCADSWELDALRPSYLSQLVENAISSMMDHGAWQKSLADEEAERRELIDRLA
jgi:hypothetical protein